MVGLMRIKILLSLLSIVSSIGVMMAETKVVSDEEAGVEVLQMPEIPSSLTSPTDRAAYLLEHFWDNM